MSLCVALASYALHYLAYRRGYEDSESDSWKSWDDDKWEQWGEDKQDEKVYKNPLIKKWLDFGGGYYGTVACIKLLFIELNEIGSFVKNFQGIDALVGKGIINLIVNLFIEQIQNFVAAIIWPTNYLAQFTIFECAAFVLVTYVAYEGARKYAKREFGKRDPEHNS